MERYDIDEYAGRVGGALAKLQAEQPPNNRSTTGGKAAVLRAAREQLRATLEVGYTVQQVIEALAVVFPTPLTPKTVRAALRDDAAPSAKTTKRRGRKTTGTAAAAAPAAAAPTAAQVSSAQADPVGALGPPPSAGPPGRADATRAGGVVAQPGPATGQFTPEQRASFQIPEWADGSDIRPGETPEKYGRRKRIEGDPARRQDRSKFIGET